MIVARSLGRSFAAGPHREVVALRDLDLAIASGELFALIGPDGAGKTTFFRIAAGLLAPSTGGIELAAGATFGLVPQRFALYEDLSIDENLRLRARLYGVDDGDAERRAADLLARVGLDRFRARLAGQLSGGMKQKLALVAALLTRPQLLLLDEPTTGVDPVSRREFWRLLNQLHHEGLTIVVSTPYMDEAEYASRLGFLDRGRLIALGTREQIVASFPRPLLEVRSDDLPGVRRRLLGVAEIDDVSQFGSRLHLRAAPAMDTRFESAVRQALAGVVADAAIRSVPPSLEDVFVLLGEAAA